MIPQWPLPPWKHNAIIMVESTEKFKFELYKKYEDCKKSQYPKIIVRLLRMSKKQLSVSSLSKYYFYLINRYKNLQSGDIEKLIKNRHRSEDGNLYCLCRGGIIMIQLNRHILAMIMVVGFEW